MAAHLRSVKSLCWIVIILLFLWLFLKPITTTAHSPYQSGTTFVVTTTGDGGDSNLGDGLCNNGSGQCTLRAAIEQANALAGTDTVTFNIPGTGPHTIQPNGILPYITDPLIIDATTQPGYAPQTPMIELNGQSAGWGWEAVGLIIAAGNSTVKGLVINDFDSAGIALVTEGGNVIQGNFLGTDPTGTIAQSNDYGLVIIWGSSNNTIGGITAAERNLISGNWSSGIHITDQSTGNVIQGNYIGTTIAGTAVLPNTGNGIELYNAANQTIGGTAVGAGNLISGNWDNGIEGGVITNTVILGNHIGTDVNGTTALGNGASGILMYSSSYNTIGGTTPDAGNLISGNGNDGIELSSGTLMTGNLILFNTIGTDINGTAALGNGDEGIEIYNATQFDISGNLISGNGDDGLEAGSITNSTITGNIIGTDINGTADLGNTYDGISMYDASTITIGGTTAVEGNLISGNGDDGIEISSSEVVTGNLILGNTIGTDVTGLVALGNGDDGLELYNLTQLTIGGTTPGARNLISGNGDDGIDVGEVTDAVIAGNIIGTNISGTAVLGNGGDGIVMYATADSIIGGATPEAGNLVSGNGEDGIELSSGTPMTNVLILRNAIGTDINGTAALGNGSDGIEIYNATQFEISYNLIAGNGSDGIEAGNITNSIITGNAIGTDINGTAVLGNSEDGIVMYAASYNTIGGPSSNESNLISGNGDDGIELSSSTLMTGNVIQGNTIGTDITGLVDLGNGSDGIEIYRATQHTIDDNLIAGNGSDGIDAGRITHSSITRNLIGTDINGTAVLSNTYDGIVMYDASTITIGGATMAEGNLISGNGDDGIELSSGTLMTNVLILYNAIGTDINGTAALGNGSDGIAIYYADGFTISSNLISGNGNDGIEAGRITNSTITGNGIGTDINGTAVLGNGKDGINMYRASYNIIGGTTAEAGNLISGNGDDGIDMGSSTLMIGNLIQGNTIGTDITGLSALGNNDNGIEIYYATQHTIDDNLISGNGDSGIEAGRITDSFITRNRIGTDGNGTAVLSNTYDGITMYDASTITIGGLTTAESNLISGNGDDGIELSSGTLMTNVLILGNAIGTDINGTAALGNGSDGIEIYYADGFTIEANLISGNDDDGIDAGRITNSTIVGNGIGTDINGTAVLSNGGDGITMYRASYNTIGGLTPEERNLISGNGDDGIELSSGTLMISNVIQGNYIGTDINGLAALGNGDDGISLYNAIDHTIGGTSAGAGNLISGNEDDGIQVDVVTNTLIIGNYIGIGADGVTAVGNDDDGVYLRYAFNTLVGGVESAAYNQVAHNGGAGVYIYGWGSEANTVQGNRLFNNAGLGIDLAPSGVTANDSGDGDAGVNRLQNFPDLTNVTGNSTSVTIAGSLNSTANVTHTLTFFSSDVCDSSGYGEGRTVLGFANIATDGTGNADFIVTLPATVVDPFVTATATDVAGNTSEFSACATAAHIRTWTTLTTTNAPLVIGEYALAYDAARQVTLLYGGNATGWPYENSTWEFDGTDWTEIATTQQPTAVYGMALAYHTAQNEMLLFGGSSADDVALAQTWLYTNANWLLLSPTTSPPARSGQAMVYETTNGRVFLFGGRDGETAYNDTWVYQAGTWSQLTTAQAPPARSYHALAYSQATDTILLFGGQDTSGTLLADTWAFDLTTDTWSEVVVTGPRPRQAHSLVYDPQTADVILVGGATSSSDSFLNDTWHYQSQVGWILANPPTPAPATAYHKMLYDDLRQSGLLFTNRQTWYYQ